jgi:catechol 2,3-dioxygenase-like lactoylglutathione lyase family enzyme
MEPIIDEMLDRFETGRLSRRALVQGLTALALAAAAPAVKAAEGGAASPVVPSGIDHVSILTKDLQGSIDFYQTVFGLQPLSEDKEHKIMRMAAGKKIIVSLREQEPYGKVDHWSFHVENFRENTDAITEKLKAHGLEPKTDWEFGYHIIDPNGVVVQLA